jgi:hypothetical protein
MHTKVKTVYKPDRSTANIYGEGAGWVSIASGGLRRR